MATVLNGLILTTLLAGALGGSTSCPRGWIANDGYCYLFAHYPQQYNEAKSYCAQHNSHLIEVDNSGVNEFIKDHLRMLNTKHWWLGLTDQVTEGAWMWERSGRVANYTDWMPGQPSSTKEDCAYFAYNVDYRWADTVCTSTMPAICEMQRYACDPEVDIIG